MSLGWIKTQTDRRELFIDPGKKGAFWLNIEEKGKNMINWKYWGKRQKYDKLKILSLHRNHPKAWRIAQRDSVRVKAKVF